MEVLAFVVFSVRCDECILSVIEIVKYALMQRQASTKDGCNHHLVVVSRDACNAERSDNVLI